MALGATVIHTAGSLLLIAVTTAAIYIFLLALLRLAGRRQLGQLTILDLVVLLLLGSAVETAMIHGNLTLPGGLVSAGTLLLCNRVMTLLFLRSARWNHLVNGGPTLLVHDGRILGAHLQSTGLTADDLAEALRSRGYNDARDVREAVLETDGTISVIDNDKS